MIGILSNPNALCVVGTDILVNLKLTWGCKPIAVEKSCGEAHLGFCLNALLDQFELLTVWIKILWESQK